MTVRTLVIKAVLVCASATDRRPRAIDLPIQRIWRRQYRLSNRSDQFLSECRNAGIPVAFTWWMWRDNGVLVKAPASRITEDALGSQIVNT